MKLIGKRIAIALVIWGFMGSGMVKAADHLNLEEGLPTEVEDAYPIPYKGIELQGQFLYQQTENGEEFGLESRIEFGFAPNWQGRITLPFQFGSAVEDGIGNVGLELFYNFNAEGLSTPAFALSGSVDFPTSSDEEGFEGTIKLIATKTLGKAVDVDRLHLNVAYTYDSNDERRNRLRAILGYSRRLGSETILVTDFVYEQEEEEERDAYVLELGVRHQVHPLTVLTVGAGAGLTADSPDFRITAGFQHSL